MRDVRAWLQLVRLPAVFTAMADIVLGWLLTHDGFAPPAPFLLLLAASASLYLAGMVFNDVFDREVDAHERPGRPIPSGRVSFPAAVTLGTVLWMGGLLAAFASGRTSLQVALLLAALILAYDGPLKKTLLGPVAMGGCRFLNVLLGASATFSSVWTGPVPCVALSMGIYVAGVTWFARNEAVQSARGPLVAAAVCLHVGLAVLAAIVLIGPAEGSRWLALVVLALIAAWIDMAVLAAVKSPAPGPLQAAVKRMLLGIVLLDAAMVYAATGRPDYAAMTAALVIPAATLGRWIFIT